MARGQEKVVEGGGIMPASYDAMVVLNGGDEVRTVEVGPVLVHGVVPLARSTDLVAQGVKDEPRWCCSSDNEHMSMLR